MPESGPVFVLAVDTDSDAEVVRLRLADEQGRQLGANQVRLSEHSPALWQGLFDTRAFVDTYAGSIRFTDRPMTAAELLDQIGLFLGEKVLGREITSVLAAGIQHRTLLVQVPKATEDRLAAAFARVPWEMARPAAGQKPLLERNVVVRMETPSAFSAPAPPALGPGEALRVLLVFAEAPGSRPLAMRLEREQLLELFYDSVMPQRRVAVDVLCHGVTRKELCDKVREASGYHVVHWSGHGQRNLLELVGEDGNPDLLTGPDLVDLFREAGGFIPQIVFLSACLSGALAGVRTWDAVAAALREGATARRAAEPAAPPAETEQLLAEQPGYTGTALALLEAGVPQVVAMRYEVGDAYARDLAGLFYRRLLADDNPKAPASALLLARSELLDLAAPEHDAVDHATPLLFGGPMGPLPVPRRRSATLSLRRPQPQPLLAGSHELDTPAELVGRGDALYHLRECLEEGRPAVALVQGLAGLGKTAVVAEAVHLWHRRFDGVFAFQAKPLPLGLDDFLRRLDERLALHSQAYRELCTDHPNAAVYLPPGKPLSGDARWRQMRGNLVEALRSERLLLVLDNFETNLEAVSGPDGYACADPEWDRLLQLLAEELAASGSRLLVTSRHRLAALSPSTRALWLPLGPLPMAEAVLFLQGSEALRRLAHGDDEGRTLALELLEVSRGHPLILTRLGALADDRRALRDALAALKAKGLHRLPDVFAPHLSEAEHSRELAYLEDVAVGAVDLLIQRATLEARRLLWLVALAFEPVTEALVQEIWSGQGAVPLAGPLLAELTGAGLLTVDEALAYGLHELVRERAAAWMHTHSEEAGGRGEEEIWAAYGERYAAAFEALLEAEGESSLDWAVEAGRRGISYFVRARAFERCGSFASEVVVSTHNPRLLGRVIEELEEVVEKAPPGKARWSLRTDLADALDRAGRSDAALQFYEQALAEAENARCWSDVRWICVNMGSALRGVGRLDDAKAMYLRGGEADRQAGSPGVDALGCELEALRIDVMKGGAGRAVPKIESRLQEVRTWWRRHCAREPSPEARGLGRAFVAGLEIAFQANLVLERWEHCINLLIELEESQRKLGAAGHELSRIRFNRYGALLSLGRLEEADHLLRGCLAVDREVGDIPGEARDLSALADLWYRRGVPEQSTSLEQQALAARNRFSDPESRSISHNNLANYLSCLGRAKEAAQHRLAAIAYNLLISHGQNLATALTCLSIDVRRAAVAGGYFSLPRLAELLALPEFEPLQRTLTEWRVPVEDIQARIDQVVEEVRRSIG